MNDDKRFWSLVLNVCLVGSVLALAMIKGCSDPATAESVLRASGYKEIKTRGWSPFTCGDDSQCTGFTARAQDGSLVTGAVGCGWVVKGCTVRVTGRR